MDTSRSYIYPVLPLKNEVLLPNMTLPVSTNREPLIAAIDAALARNDKTLLVLTQKDPTIEQPRPEDLFHVGTSAIIRLMARSDSAIQIILQGHERVEIIEFEQTIPYLEARIKLLPFALEEGLEAEALQRELIGLLNRYFELSHPELNIAIPKFLATDEDLLRLIFPLKQLFIYDHRKAQILLESPSRTEAMRMVRELLSHEIQVLELHQKIVKQTQEKLSREQHDYFLRQQLKEIQRELGEKSPGEMAATDLRQRLQDLELPEVVKIETEKELDYLERLQIVSPEYQIVLSHLELIQDLPWHNHTTDQLSLANARAVLDEDHFGLKEIKERIIEFLAVMKLNPATKSPILCFVGPPGVGKTSLGQSIARALGRKFERFSLGGLHDEAELRGHRRTYIGAMPGRIIQTLRRAGVNNPLVMLDEIDKLGRDFRGDPAAALMEILDPAQNNTFHDNYLDLPFDLSQIFFITTANTMDTIPKPLLDRMEVLRLTGYYEEEKLEIVRRYLFPRQRMEAGLQEEQLIIPDETLLWIIRRYTREAGVREVERMLGRLARKVAVLHAEGSADRITVQPEKLPEMLGPERFFMEQQREHLPPGVATGLAWTEIGGEILYVEAIALPPGQEFLLTGHLGDVMKESARTAHSYILSCCAPLGVTTTPPVHIHVPAGAIPKDGPSAGITMAVALASLFTGYSVSADTAMTGEITLSGLVMPVGGIKEKLLAARRAGIRRIILPRDNRKDLFDLPDYAVKEMEFVFVATVKEVLTAAISQLAGLELE